MESTPLLPTDRHQLDYWGWGVWAHPTHIRHKVMTSFVSETADIKGNSLVTVRGYMATVRGYMATVRGYMVTVWGHMVTVRGYMLTVWGHMLTVRGYMLTVWGYMVAALDHKQRVWLSPDGVDGPRVVLELGVRVRSVFQGVHQLILRLLIHKVVDMPGVWAIRN
eukprot:9486702-Pyramimonas_sp.AAC.1